MTGHGGVQGPWLRRGGMAVFKGTVVEKNTGRPSIVSGMWKPSSAAGCWTPLSAPAAYACRDEAGRFRLQPSPYTLQAAAALCGGTTLRFLPYT